LLLGIYPIRCQTPQTVDLTGMVSDAVTRTVVGGADVVLRGSSGAVLARVVSGSDGIYKASGLKPGDSVAIYYQHGGYLPRPAGPVAVVLANRENVKNLQLIEDSKQATYWSQWAKQTKSSVETYTTDTKQRDALYNQLWSSLGVYGFSSISQALAARGIAEATPDVPHSRQLMSFASVDLETLEQADSSIRAAVDGQGKLSSKYSIPSDVAVAIAASELKKKGSTTPPPEFMKSFGAVWGDEATGDLSHELSASPTTKGAVTKAWDKTNMLADKP
jgi:hypothetical protein